MEAWLESFAHANFLRSADTAHDLKTPLNVAVLNLELLRMRLRKLNGADDEKLNAYAQSIETELRRMARIFDAFFLLSTPPRNEGDPVTVDICPLCRSAASDAGFSLVIEKAAPVHGHESRLRQALKYLFEGASHVLDQTQAAVEVNGHFAVEITGEPRAEDFEVTKLFKFYYTDPQGNPDLSLSAARLIAETYGGALSGSHERDKVRLRMTFPLGEK